MQVLKNLNTNQFAGGREFGNVLTFGQCINPFDEGKIVAEIDNPADVGKLRFFSTPKKKKST